MWDAISGFLITWYRLIPSLTTVHLIVLLVLGAIHGAMVNRLPMFNDTPVNVTYHKGDRAILQCSIKHLGTNRVIWKREDGNTVLTVGKQVFAGDKDLKITHLPLRDEWNLIINNVKPTHAGRYECQISTAGVLRRYVRLNVINSPAPRGESIIITGEDFVEKGNKISLICNATGDTFPPEDIDWFKDGVKIKQNQNKGVSIVKFRLTETKTLHSKLVIDRSDMLDSGNYICRSSDLAITSKHVMVLNGKPNINIKPRSQGDNYIRKGTVKRQRKDGVGRVVDAETNPNKRDGQSARSTNSTPSTKSAFNVLVFLLTFLSMFWPH